MGNLMKPPVGSEFFEQIRTENEYYVDKTGLIVDLIEKGARVNLFTRPRRFGKTLAMTTLKRFFEYDAEAELFEGLEISRHREICDRYMGRFPIIFLTLKGVQAMDFAGAKETMEDNICREFARHRYLLDSEILASEEKDLFYKYITRDIGVNDIYNSILVLSQMLKDHHGQKVIILIDEYDVPLDKAYKAGYYDEMVNLIRVVFGNALKTNDSLQMAVLTGCLRISKESIFTGLNNFKVYTMTDLDFSEYFGFTNDEVREMLGYYGCDEAYDTIKEWYDGYLFGKTEIYCPWDVINYVSEIRSHPEIQPKNYWVNSSGNDLLVKFIEDTNMDMPDVLEDLIAGETIEKAVTQELTYRELTDTEENIWTVLYMTGYLTVEEMPVDENYRLMIPNREIRNLIVSHINRMFRRSVRADKDRTAEFAKAFLDGNKSRIQDMFNEYMSAHISIRDTSVKLEMKENFYHGYLLGILQNVRGARVVSNRESGEGYADILMIFRDKGVGMIIEVKYAEDDRLDYWSKKALEQIDDKNYKEGMSRDDINTVLKYGIACYKKHCMVIKA